MKAIAKHLGILLLLAIVFIIYILIMEALFDHGCMFKAILGVPCPGCGITRAFKNCLFLNIKKAFYYHPLFPLYAFSFLVLWLCDYKFFKKILFCKWYWIMFFSLTITVFIIRMVVVFPNKPLNMNYDAPLIKLIEKIKS